MTILLICGFGAKKSTDLNFYTTQPASAQTTPTSYQVVGASDVWRQVYQQLPYLPLENQYVSQETGKVDSNSTLMSRLIRYHIYVKGRPSLYRLDWKLTLADYLGANETMDEGRYPGVDTLRKNPLDGDRDAIGRLNLAQRNALVQVLVNIFNPKYQAEESAASDSSAPQTQPTPRRSTPSRPSITQPKPGDAHLLMP
ncbi:MAG: hypothetical protein JO235_15275 [Chroococcidiopsidaceae cyanobacterium CP_BM_RX_35]|nr:hypothetical protein [Chroococcidiopsidaceae cyanobacterium CP_BM_RX_35]